MALVEDAIGGGGRLEPPPRANSNEKPSSGQARNGPRLCRRAVLCTQQSMARSWRQVCGDAENAEENTRFTVGAGRARCEGSANWILGIGH
eukprot:scaffold64626_cov64-Phaeocystis_antarctica.AAC.2